MKKSMFKRFFITFVSLVLACFILLSFVILALSGKKLIDRYKDELSSGVLTIVHQVETASFVYGGDRLTQYAYEVTTLVGTACEGNYLLVNSEGEIITFVGAYVENKNVDKKILARALNNDIDDVSDLNGVLSCECLIVSAPIMINNAPRGIAFGAIPMSMVGDYLKTLLRVLLVSMVVVTAAAVAAAYFTASRLVRPLTQMSHAAVSLANGDYSHRITVDRQDELGQLAQAFNDMTLSLEAGEKMRSGFVTNVSHELKTPMTTIAGFIDGILDGTIPAQRQEHYLKIVEQEVRRLSRLVNTMLNLSKLDSGEIRLCPEAMDLSALTVQTALLFEQKAKEKSLNVVGLEQLPALPLTADKDLLQQVVYNLLDNAVKYTPDGGTVSFFGRAEEKAVSLTVRNTCGGIDESKLPFVFDRFYKVDASRGKDRNSLGLGLYLVKTIVTLHGGTITVRSLADAYCEFEILLPSAALSAVTSQEKESLS